MQSLVILLVGSVVADYPYYTDYNSYNSVYAPISSNISSRLHDIKRTWNPNGPFTFGLSNQLLKSIQPNMLKLPRYEPNHSVGRPGCQPECLFTILVDFQWGCKARL